MGRLYAEGSGKRLKEKPKVAEKRGVVSSIKSVEEEYELMEMSLKGESRRSRSKERRGRSEASVVKSSKRGERTRDSHSFAEVLESLDEEVGGVKV